MKCCSLQSSSGLKSCCLLAGGTLKSSSALYCCTLKRCCGCTFMRCGLYSSGTFESGCCLLC